MRQVLASLAVLVLALLVLGGVIVLRHEVRDSGEELLALRAEATRLEEERRVLRAEWSYVNRPEALADLARRHLGLGPGHVEARDRISLLPRRLPSGGGAGASPEGGERP